VSAVARRLAARLLAAAVLRWPPHLRQDLSREWAAELHELSYADVATPVRIWRQLHFAASLALARPPVADGAPLPGPIRAAPAQVHATWLVLAPVLTLLATVVALVPLQALPFGWVTITPTTSAFFVAENYLVEAAVAALAGTWLARRVRRRRGRPLGAAGCAWATLPVIVGLVAVDGLARGSGHLRDGGRFAILAALCLAVLLPPIAVAAAALSRHARRGTAIALAALAVPLLTLATAGVLAHLAPETPSAAVGRPWWWLDYLGREPLLSISYPMVDDPLPIEAVLSVLPAFVFAAVVFALAHVIELAGPTPSRSAAKSSPAPATTAGPETAAGLTAAAGAETAAGLTATAGAETTAGPTATGPTAAGPDVGIPDVAQSPWWHRTALAGAAYSVVAWAVTLAYLTPNIGVQNSWPSRAGADGQLLPAEPAGWPGWTTEEGRLWMHELQLSTIVAAALCLVCAAAYRGRPLAPALAGAATLLAINMTVVNQDWAEPRLLPWLAGGGLILGQAAWLASTRPAAAQRPLRHPRRLVITVTVLAAFLAPAGFLHRIYAVDRPAPPSLLLVAVGLPALLAGLAAMGVLATSTCPPRGPAWRLPAALTLATATGGVLYYRDGLIHDLAGHPALAILMIAPVAAAVPVAAWTIAAIHGRPPWRRWLLLTPPLMLAGLPVAFATIMGSFVLARLVLFPMEYGQTYDGLAYVPGAVAGGLLAGYIAALRLDRKDPVPAEPAATARDLRTYGEPQSRGS
jgi:hypothetical protein